MLLRLAGANYKNEFVTMPDVAANRADYPFGHVPVLVEHRADGTTFELGEAIAIEVKKTPPSSSSPIVASKAERPKKKLFPSLTI